MLNAPSSLLIPTILCCLLITTHKSLAQQRKTIQAERTTNSPKIDGILDDILWENLPGYGDFNKYQPGNEGEIPNEYRTEVKLAYDDQAVYVAAYMYHPNPSEIRRQFSQRDDVNVQADVFTFAINTYNDGINETRFFVTSAGTIGDSRLTLNRQDFGYDVVFECRTSFDSNGWYAEYRIPYNALRFPEAEVQNWSVNFYRKLTNRNETHSWSFIKNGVGRETQYNGLVKGVYGINPPVRLTLFPFGQGVISNFDGETETNFSAGLDLKYGISDSFTLDATLIPDFGQAAFDEVTLNLGPFEQTFGENRQFFTEGTDLFNKGGIFFSRRIGNAPTGRVTQLADNETITELPSRVNLLNALKLSGRTKDGLGIGFLNAITENTFARIRNNDTGAIREVLVEPLSNYNVFVLDQNFNDNSSISIINTNVTREGSFRDANTTGLVFDVSDKGNNFAVSGRAINSNTNGPNGVISGFLSELDIAKTKGNFRYRVGHDFSNTTFDINDFGISFRNNFNNIVAAASYEIFEPTKTFNRYRFTLTGNHRRLYRPSVETGNTLSLDAFFTTVNRLTYGFDASYNSEEKDYFEPRVPGRFVLFEPNIGGGAFVSTDFRKKFAFELRLNYRSWLDDPQKNYFIEFEPRFRVSNQLLIIMQSGFSLAKKNFGFVNVIEDCIFFGQRDITDIENSISASYNFDPYKALSLRFRNFWSTADYSYDIFTTLNEDGSRSPAVYDITNNRDPNTNFNIWNLDLSFRWRFAPGSEATLLYRNQIFNRDNLASLGYAKSLDNLFSQPQQNTLSLRITYFIDYNNIRHLINQNS